MDGPRQRYSRRSAFSLPRSTTCWWSSNSTSSATTSAASPSRCAREGDAVTNAVRQHRESWRAPASGPRQAPGRKLLVYRNHHISEPGLVDSDGLEEVDSTSHVDGDPPLLLDTGLDSGALTDPLQPLQADLGRRIHPSGPLAVEHAG